MGDIGVFEPEARIELIDGELFGMPPIGPPHASRTTRISTILHQGVRGRAIVSTQNPIILGNLNAPQPDIAVLKPREDFYATEHPQPDDILLLVEVADASLAHARDRKLPLDARFATPEVWLIDMTSRTVTVHGDPLPEQASYGTCFPLDPPGLIRPLMLADVELDLPTLL